MSGSLYIGLMSGTSLDGADAALVDLQTLPPRCIATAHLDYPADLRAAALALHAPGADDLHTAALFGNRLADLYADTVAAVLEKARLAPAAVSALGAHGQTMRHNPAAGYTLQLLNGARLAERTGITTVCDFRSRDIAAGGQGAPLVPAFHDAVFRSANEHRIVLNLGGIANLTDLAPGKPTRGFDTGPGNMLLDAWIQHTQGKLYDAQGAWGASGKASEALIGRLMQHAFLDLPPPKSCGREEFNLQWLLGLLEGNEAPVDVQASLVELTARSVVDAIHAHCGEPDALFVCGGGARNDWLVQTIRQQLPATRVAATDTLGMPAEWVEAIAFAWLAQQTLLGRPGNLPAVTGALGPRILGAIYPA